MMFTYLELNLKIKIVNLVKILPWKVGALALLKLVGVLFLLCFAVVDFVDSVETDETRLFDVVVQESICQHFVDFAKIA